MLHVDDEQALLSMAMTALQDKTLPRDPPTRAWGGQGSGEQCPVCLHQVGPTEIELELEFTAADGRDSRRELHLHLPCFVAWQSARESTASATID